MVTYRVLRLIVPFFEKHVARLFFARRRIYRA